MAVGVNARQTANMYPAEEIPFIDQHFAKIAFAVSAVALILLQPLSLLLGSVAGFFLHQTFEPNLVIKDLDQIVTVGHAAMVIVAAAAALIQLTPGGAMGGYFFQSLPCIFSMAVGSAAFSAFQWWRQPQN